MTINSEDEHQILSDLIGALVEERDQARAALMEVKEYVWNSGQILLSDKVNLTPIIQKGLGA